LPRTYLPTKPGDRKAFYYEKGREGNAPPTADKFAFIKTKIPSEKIRGEIYVKFKTLNFEP
jgi:hypothetical protein